MPFVGLNKANSTQLVLLPTTALLAVSVLSPQVLGSLRHCPT